VSSFFPLQKITPLDIISCNFRTCFAEKKEITQHQPQNKSKKQWNIDITSDNRRNASKIRRFKPKS
jgi:hypothetical protein